ncbi:MAG: hypothetical protein JWN04_1132 [Myxococcaceae bacterium]|nr:hypothetical protein [Myxococcaceae bacterium]
MQIKKILVAHDFSEPAGRALAFAHALARRLSAALEVVHVQPDSHNGHTEAALAAPWPSAEEEARYLRFLEQELERVVQAVLLQESASVKRHLVRGDPIERIKSLATDIGAQLICLGSTGKGAVERLLLGSISERVVRTSTLPVLTVH